MGLSMSDLVAGPRQPRPSWPRRAGRRPFPQMTQWGSREVILVSRDELVRRVAAVSQETWMRQKHRDHGRALDEVPSDVTEHDVERAEDTVADRERLGLHPSRSRQGWSPCMSPRSG